MATRACAECSLRLPKLAFSTAQLKKGATSSRCLACVASSQLVHHGFFCNASGVQPIVGPRYHLAGWDIDLCEAEFEKLDGQDQWRFEKITEVDESEGVAEHPPEALLAALFAADSGALALPSTSTFEPLLPVAINVPLTPTAATAFASHTAFEVPREPSAAGVGSAGTVGVHRFCVNDKALLNEGLKSWALSKEAQASVASAADDDEKVVGVSVSNRGGFQSAPDIFIRMPSPSPELERENFAGRRHCRELHLLASVAIDEINGVVGALPAAEQLAASERGDETIRNDALAWLNVCHRALHPTCPQTCSHSRTGLRGAQSIGTESPANGCALRVPQVNRASDLNLMHIHAPDRWSATYYVDGGEEFSDSAGSHDGNLILRSGGKPRPTAPGATTAPLASHSFMAIPPVAGTLWIFPGWMPHRVIGMTSHAAVLEPAPEAAAEAAKAAEVSLGPPPSLPSSSLPLALPPPLPPPAQGQQSRALSKPRISVAINFLDAALEASTTPTTRDDANALGRMESELHRQLTPRKLSELRSWEAEYKHEQPSVYRAIVRDLHARVTEVLASRATRLWYSRTTRGVYAPPTTAAERIEMASGTCDDC